MRKSLVDRLAALEAERQRLTERIWRERARLRDEERRRTARQRFVIGQAVLDVLHTPGAAGATARDLLRGVLGPAELRLIGLGDADTQDTAKSARA